ncbi:MAG: TIGR01777 family protein [Deltaproteobacteria bacterium]|nr:TIGR01777 family protein [Deltaproteobacteria bacterium]
MKVLITGGLGFVGTQLSIRLLERGHAVTVVGRSRQRKPYTPEAIQYISADTTIRGPWQEALKDQDAVVNLAGASIFTRWTKKTKKRLYDSRVVTTQNVVEGLSSVGKTLLCSTSAVGYYGFRDDETLTEEASPGNDFLANLCVDWEKEAGKASEKGCRVIINRFGIVLGKTGGALGQMIPAFKRFVGGPLGSGKQWFSWMHMEDLINAFLFAFEHKDLEGPVNLCAPNPVQNRDLAKAFGRALSRPSFVKTPGFALRLAMGELGSLLLEGQRVIPEKLLRYGFQFTYPTIEGALREALSKA